MVAKFARSPACCRPDREPNVTVCVSRRDTSVDLGHRPRGGHVGAAPARRSLPTIGPACCPRPGPPLSRAHGAAARLGPARPAPTAGESRSGPRSRQRFSRRGRGRSRHVGVSPSHFMTRNDQPAPREGSGGALPTGGGAACLVEPAGPVLHECHRSTSCMATFHSGLFMFHVSFFPPSRGLLAGGGRTAVRSGEKD